MTDQIQKTIELKATRSRVWRALTDYREFGTWFRVNIDGPFAVGQSSRGQLTYPGYEHVKWNAEVAAMEPEHLFSFRWHPYAVDAQKDYSDEPMTLVEFRIEETKDGVRLTVTESGFSKLTEPRQREAFPRNESGWGQQLRNLESYVANQAVTAAH